MDIYGGSASRLPGKARRRSPRWEAASVRTLRRHLGLSQRAMADELGTRQQTISEWETGLYRPRGASARLLTIVAERAGFQYEAEDRKGGARKARSDGGGAKG